MKNFYTSIKILAIVLILGGCTKDEPGPGTPSSNAASINAIVNFKSWSSLSQRASATFSNGAFNLRGVALDSTLISITINENVEVGIHYSLDPTSTGVGMYGHTSDSTPAWTSNYVSGLGDLRVTTKDTVNKKISGHFEYLAWSATNFNTKEVRSGVFTHVPYVDSITSTVNPAFSVKVDGVDFLPAVITGDTAFGMLNLVGSVDSVGTRAVRLHMPDNITPGTYALGDIIITFPYYAQYSPNATTGTMSNSGSLTISSHNMTTHTISGTFYFSSNSHTGGPPYHVLTDGTFTIIY